MGAGGVELIGSKQTQVPSFKAQQWGLTCSWYWGGSYKSVTTAICMPQILFYSSPLLSLRKG